MFSLDIVMMDWMHPYVNYEKPCFLGIIDVIYFSYPHFSYFCFWYSPLCECWFM